MRKKVSAMLEIVVCDDDIADLECAVNMLHKIFTSQKIAYHIEQLCSYNMIRTTYQVICHIRNCMIT